MATIFKISLQATIFLATTPALLLAAGEGGPHISHLFWYAVNFCLYVAFLFWLLRKPLGKFWVKRRDEIETAVTRGEREMQAAKAALMAATEKISNLTPEYLKDVVSQIEAEGYEEAKKIVEAAHLSELQIKKNTAQSIKGEWVKSEQNVRQEIAERVIARATERVKATYSEEMDRQRRDKAVAGSAALVQ